MSGSNRLLAVLQLFEDGGHVWTVEEIGAELGISVSTAYRLVRELVKAGFLDPVTGAGYALGPAFIRYDRILRQSDSLIQIAGPIMRNLLRETNRAATAVLCRRFKDCVMCVHEVRGEDSRALISYERGVAMPMFFGATSKVILAQLPDRMLRGIYLSNESKIRRSAPKQDWNSFKIQLRGIRRAGFAITESEVSPGRIGVAAPISRGDQVIASLSLIMAANGWNRTKAAKLAPTVIDAAKKVSAALSKKQPIIPR